MNPVTRSCLGVFVLAAAALTARADPAAVVARARAHLGSDEALRAVTSVRFVGTYQSEVDGEKRMGTIDMIFQKPYFHRATIATDTTIETTGLDDYEGWMSAQDPKDKTRMRLTTLRKEDIKGLRTNTWETLSFYEGIEARGGKVVELGEETLDGVVAVKLAFEHEPGVIFHRFFDKATGKLLQTETSQGNTREEGSRIVNGVRFPERLITRVKAAGRERVITLVFQDITVNEVFPPSTFRIPSVPIPQFPAAQAAPVAPAISALPPVPQFSMPPSSAPAAAAPAASPIRPLVPPGLPPAPRLPERTSP